VAGSLGASLVVAGAAAGVGTAGAATARRAVAHRSLTTLNLSYTQYANDGALFLGMKRGFFAKEGLKLNLSPAANPGVTVAGMASGQYQLGFLTFVVAIDATAHGSKVKCVSNVDGNQGANVAQDGTLILAAPKSGITSVKQLVGKTVATVQTSSLNSLTTDEMVYEAGGNPGQIHYVTMGFAEMPQALAQGSVQAAIATSPFGQYAAAEGAKVLGHPNVAIMSNQSTTCFGATDGWLAHHVKEAHEFQTAMNESIAYNKSHQKAGAATLVTAGLAKNLQQALGIKLGTNWNPKLLNSSVILTEHLMERFGFMRASEAPSPSSVIFPGT
jgi:NitT/TauT family transport system substrate-binding protein